MQELSVKYYVIKQSEDKLIIHQQKKCTVPLSKYSTKKKPENKYVGYLNICTLKQVQF